MTFVYSLQLRGEKKAFLVIGFYYNNLPTVPTLVYRIQSTPSGYKTDPTCYSTNFITVNLQHEHHRNQSRYILKRSLLNAATITAQMTNSQYLQSTVDIKQDNMNQYLKKNSNSKTIFSFHFIKFNSRNIFFIAQSPHLDSINQKLYGVISVFFSGRTLIKCLTGKTCNLDYKNLGEISQFIVSFWITTGTIRHSCFSSN